MSYFGDIRLGDTIDIKFTTRQISGAPSTLASSPVISAYPGNSTTELTAGITLSVDFDSRTGLNNVRVVATSGNGYATATNYELVITTGTVNSVSVVGECIGSFSIENRSALMPTTAARTLVVDAAGLADANMVKAGPTGSGTAQTAGDVYSKVSGLTFTVANQVDVNVKDWAGSAVASAAAGIPKVDVDTIKTNPVVNAGTITFPTTATLASTTNITAGTITTVGTLTTYTGNTPQTGDSFARIGAAGASLTAVGLTGTQTFNNTGTWTGSLTGSVGSVTGAVGSVTGLTASNLDTTVSSRLATASYVSPTTALTESYSTLHAAPTEAQLLFEIRGLVQEKAVSGTTLTVKGVDGATSKMTFTLNDATSPTAITRAS